MTTKLHPAILELETEIESINMLVYGDSGVGKTIFGGTAPRALILSTETGGTVSAKIHGSKARFWPIKTWNDLQDAYDWIKENPDHGFDWVIVDTTTEMQMKLIYHLLHIAVSDNEDRNPDIPAQADHQEWQNKFLRFIDHFIDLPVNVLFLAHAMTVEDDDGNEVLLPQLKGGENWKVIARSMCAKMSIVGYMRLVIEKGRRDTEVEVRRIRWRKSPKVFAKDRTDSLGISTDDITMDQVARKIGAAVGVGPIKDIPVAQPANNRRRTTVPTKAAPRRRRASTTP